jgi:hypothetical protein
MTATLRTDFDAFLFAPIGDDINGIPLTPLSVFARLGVDPWEEAADIAQLPLETALQRLASRLDAVPNGQVASPEDTVNIATRLIALLHRAPARKVSAPEPIPPPLQRVIGRFEGVSRTTYVLIAVILLLLCQLALSASDTPGSDTPITADMRR